MNLNTNAIIELAKSFGRFLYFGLLGLVGTFLVSLASNPAIANAYIHIGNAKVSVGFLILGGIAGLAKLVDRYRHLDDSLSNGIAPTFLQR